MRTLAILSAIALTFTLTGRISLTVATLPDASRAEARTLAGPAFAAAQAYESVVTVARSGGDFTTITDALNSITNNSATNHYLVWVAPGVYTESVTMKQFVDIEGSGEKATRITFKGSGATYIATLTGANNVENNVFCRLHSRS